MTTTPILDIQQVASNQNQKEVTINDAILVLENATQAAVAWDFTAGDIELTKPQLAQAFFHRCLNVSTTRTLTVQAQSRFFAVLNEGVASLTIKCKGGTAGVGEIVIEGGKTQLCYAEATTHKIVLIEVNPFTGTGAEVTLFTQLTDAPHDYAGQGGKGLRVKADGTGLEFYAVGDSVTSFLGLSDTPTNYATNAGKFLKVNPGETGIQFSDVTLPDSILDFPDAPATYVGQGLKAMRVREDETGIEFFTLVAGGGSANLSALADVNVTEGAGIDGYVLSYDQATGKWIAVAGGGGGGTGSDPAVGAWRYWRLTSLATKQGTAPCLAGIQAKYQGALVTISAADASSRYNDDAAYAASKALDGDASTFWNALANVPAWFELDMGTSQQIDELLITARNDGYEFLTPVSFVVEASNDRVTWLNVGYVSTTGGFTSGQTKSFTIPTTSTYVTAGGDGGTGGALDDLSDVTLGTPQIGDSLYYNGSVWVAGPAQSVLTSDDTSRTLDVSDRRNRFLNASSASGIVYTIPPNSSVAFPIGTEIAAVRSGVGDVSFAAGSGVSLLFPTGYAAKARAQYSVLTIKKMGTDTWLAFGDLGA